MANPNGGLRKLRECPKCGLGMPDSHVCKVTSKAVAEGIVAHEHNFVFSHENNFMSCDVCGEDVDAFMFPENRPNTQEELMKATIGSYADYLVFDPDGLTGEPRYEVCGEKRSLEEGYAMFFSVVGPTVAEMFKRPEKGQP